jgi:shikimate kinase / 3-dehydroquinate synthase
VDPLDRPLAIIGFMGAGKSTLGREAADRVGRSFVDIDELVEAEYGGTVTEIFARDGEERFRDVEEEWAVSMIERSEGGVVALGGGAIESERTRECLREHATTVWLDVPVDEAWRRAQGTARPLAQDEADFRGRYERRRPLYEAAADFVAHDLDDLVLAAGGVRVEVGALERLGELVPGDGPVELVSDTRVAGIYGMDVQLALGARITASHELPPGEEAKTVAAVERLWHTLRLERGGTLLALGGGCTTDAAGFAAAAYMRGIDWVAVPTTLVGQVDAAIGGKTAIDLPAGKNLVGAFHWPVRTVVDPGTLETLPDSELENGRAELVKTGLLAGEPFWELPLPEAVRRSAAFKTAVCLRDPHDRGERAQLNLGHTFAHALEAAAGFELPHGRAVALGLLAALRLSGLDTQAVEETLRPNPVRVDRDRAWSALARDKKAVGGVPRLVLLEAPGRPRLGVQLPEDEVRAALDALIAS